MIKNSLEQKLSKMKKYILLFFLLYFGGRAWAQYCEPNTIAPTVNIWDWRQGDNYIYHIEGDDSPPNGLSPFVQVPHIEQTNVTFLQANTDPDNFIEDGWELIVRNFGTPNIPVNAPCLLLYNKFEAKLRVFFLFKYDSELFNGALIRFSFNTLPAINPMTNLSQTYQSALFEYAKTPLNAVEKLTNDIIIEVPNEYKSAGYTWLHADIPVAYDPCTCQYPSRINIEPVLIRVSKIDLKMDGGGEINQILDNTSSASTSHSKFVSNIHKVNQRFSKGVKAYKYLAGFTETITKMDSTVYSINGNPITQKKYVKEKVPVIKFPEWAKKLPQVGEAIAILDLFMGGGKETSVPKPMRFEADLSFQITGLDSIAVPYSPMLVNTPGTNKTGLNQANNPSYDNILGHFNLLTQPIIEQKIERTYDDFPAPNWYPPWVYQESRIFKIKDDIDYVINPASGFSSEPHEIRASIYIHTRADADSVDTKGLIFSYLEKGSVGASVFRTPYLPLGCIKDYVFSIERDPSFVSTPPIDLISGIFIKIKVIFNKADPNANDEQKAIFLGKYNVGIEDMMEDFVPGALADITEIAVIDSITLQNDTLIYAWDSVYLGKEIITNGHHLHVISGGKIEIGSSDLLPDVTAEIGSPGGCERDVFAATQDQIHVFCNDPEKYNPILLRRASHNPPSSKEAFNFNLKAYPNPFDEHIKFSFELPARSSVSLIITNQMGQQLFSLLDKEQKAIGRYQLTWSAAGIAPGFYFAILKSEKSSKTIKLIKY